MPHPAAGTGARSRARRYFELNWTRQPHDALFKVIFGVTANVIAYLQAVLPPELLAMVDLSKLTRVPDSFVDAGTLRLSFADTLYRAPLAGGRPGWVYFLLEHQSSGQLLLSRRIHRYIALIWHHHVREHPADRTLPLVIAVVMHHSPRGCRWRTARTELRDLLDPALTAAAGPLAPSGAFLLDDLMTLSDAQLLARRLPPPAHMAQFLLKHARHGKELQALAQTRPDPLTAVLAEPRWEYAAEAMLAYIDSVTKATSSEMNDLAARLGPDFRKVHMGVYQTAEALGEARGRALGEARGRARGEARGRADTLLHVLAARNIKVPADKRAQIRACTDTGTLTAWAGKAANATTLSDVFDD